MGHSAADHVLLFGMIALQVQAITQDQLLAALKSWLQAKERKLSDILVEDGVLEAAQVEAIETLVAARIIRDGNAANSIVSSDGYQTFRERLAEFEDRDVAATLALLDTAVSTRPVLPTDQIENRSAAGAKHRFEAIRFHDEGGLGRVFEARDRELNRNVALKEIKELFADDIESRQRFVMEAEITGRLEHPGIVPVYGLGHYDDGRPYYAMRFIHGDSFRDAIKRYHEVAGSHQRAKASFELRKLLNRFLDVCHAIHYAHRRGILHRDIKPSNVMLGEYGETLVVDWGLAKPIGEREEFDNSRVEHEEALLPVSGSTIAPTIVGRAVGSPPYMSPEQARGDHEHLGPATDIYSLGATLHTLLTNKTPVAGPTSEDVLREVRRGNATAPRDIIPTVPGALDAICRRAMAAESADRYASVAELSDDIERYLADEPVSAYDEPWRERLFRFGRRHKTLVQAAMIGLLLVATISLGAALRLQLQAAMTQARRAKVASARAEFTQILLSNSSKPSDMSPAELQGLDDQVKAIADRLGEDARAEADFVEVASEKFLLDGIYESAERWAQRAYELRSEALGTDAQETVFARLLLARSLAARAKYQEALDAFTQIQAYFGRRLGPRHPMTLNALNNMAAVNGYLGNFEAARKILEELVEIRTEVLGPAVRETLNAKNNLAMTFRNLGRREEALNMLKAVLEIRLVSPGKKDPLTLQSMNNVAQLLTELGQHEAGIAMLEETLEARKNLLGERHPDTLTTMQNLAAAYALVQQWDEAKKVYQVVTSERARLLGPDHPITLFAELGLAKTTYRAEGVAGTADRFQRVYTGWKAAYGIDDARTVDVAKRFVLASIEEGRFRAAEPICVEVIEALKNQPARRALFQVCLAEIMLGQGELDAAATAAAAAIPVLKRVDGAAWTLAAAESVLGQVWSQRGDADQARTLFDSASARFDQAKPRSYEAFRREVHQRRVAANEA